MHLFQTVTCCFCNGYYGPCFGEPVCATCHAFLFPNDVGLLQVPIFSEVCYLSFICIYACMQQRIEIINIVF